jgi:hypothetical protein
VSSETRPVNIYNHVLHPRRTTGYLEQGIVRKNMHNDRPIVRCSLVAVVRSMAVRRGEMSGSAGDGLAIVSQDVQKRTCYVPVKGTAVRPQNRT